MIAPMSTMLRMIDITGKGSSTAALTFIRSEIWLYPRASVYPVLECLSPKRQVAVSNTSQMGFNPMRPDKATEILLLSAENSATRGEKP